jgi:hypothetical protein
MSHRLAFAALLALTAPAAANPQPRVDLVIALDTSGSMRGLIDATRAQLWNAVRLLGRAQPQPIVRVGLMTFGGKWNDPAAGWVKREIDLTTDLDAVSSRLFALPVGGSREYVARTVQTATRAISWDQSPSTLKILFVAGNESAEQDPRVGLGAALAEARRRGILVNAIYCGTPEHREAGGWRVVASAGGGQFAAIDHTRVAATRATPYDANLARLSKELSGTYVGFGRDGEASRARQASEDERAAADSTAVAAERAVAKASSAYRNEKWDAVDAYQQGVKLGGVDEATLRANLEQRRRVQAQISDLAARRDAYLAGATPAAAPPPMAAPPRVVVSSSAITIPAADPAAAPRPAAKPAKRAPPRATMEDAFSGTLRKQASENGYSF